MQVNVFETHSPSTTYLRAGRAAIAVKSRSVVNFTHLPLPLNVFRFRFVYQNRLSVISPTTDPVDCHRLRSVSCYFYKFTHNNYAQIFKKRIRRARLIYVRTTYIRLSNGNFKDLRR